MEAEASQIRTFLRRIRRMRLRGRMAGVSEATFWISLFGLLAGMVLLGAFFQGWLRGLLWGLWCAAILGLWIGRLVIPGAKERKDSRLANQLERQHPWLRNDLTSSLAFYRLLRQSGPQDRSWSGSPELMGALVTHTARSLPETASLAAESPTRYRPSRLRLAGLASLLLALALLLLWPKLAMTGLARLFWLEPTLAITTAAPSSIEQDPLVASIVVTYRFPGYTRLPLRRESNPTGRIEVLAGTEVTIEALSLREIRRATLLVRSGDLPDHGVTTEIGVEVAQRALRTTFSPLSSGSYQFRLDDRHGNSLVDPVVRTISVLPDEVPQVQLAAPQPVVEAAPAELIPFEFSVSDDFGLTEVAFVHAFASAVERERRQTLMTLEDTFVQQDVAGFDLAPLELQPGDEIVTWVEAVDNDTVGGPKAGRSRQVLIRITSPEQRHLALIEREAQIFEGLLDLLGDYLEARLPDPPEEGDPAQPLPADLSPDQSRQLFTQAVAANGKLSAILEQMSGLLRDMEMDELFLRRDFELFRSAHLRLDQLYQREQNVLVSLQRPANRGSLGTYHLLRIQPVRVEQVSETERTVLTLEELIESQRMESMSRTLQELREIQSRLRQLLEEYRETQDAELREQIEQELARLQDRMEEVLSRLAELMQHLPEEHYNLDALQEMGMLADVADMNEALERIRQMMDSNDIEGALEALDELESQIQAMLDQVSESQTGGGGAVSEMDRLMSELMDAVADLESQEQQIEGDTATLEQEIRQRRMAEVQRQLGGFIQQARREVAAMREQLAAIETERLRTDIARSLERADGQLETLDQRLAQERIELALESIGAALNRLGEASFEVTIELAHGRPHTPRHQAFQDAQERLRQVTERSQSLALQLEELLRQASSDPAAQDWSTLFELARSQGITLEELASLMQRVDEMSQEIPLAGEELTPPFQEIQEFMEGARNQLLRGQLPGAREDEQSALQRLRQLRQSMRQMVARERMGRRLENRLVERVEIPEQADETPAEFREELLDAMKEQSIEAYQEVIRRYYQSLVE